MIGREWVVIGLRYGRNDRGRMIVHRYGGTGHNTSLEEITKNQAGLISVREEFNQSIEGLITLIEHEELKETLLTTEISQETPRLNQEAKEADQDVPHTPRRAQEQLKISSTPFLPVLQGTKETTVFIITKQVEALP
ncbi:unnamed protein product [Microthlaspi erraticum]|uniref:Uncharacterized protein n=1 Tax=Microthlaspi erraticum TaxID=1685480 RepID=A0A6D2JBB9_9BRAS|nr:unnamed protein product [Microthlaspi erraticum]